MGVAFVPQPPHPERMGGLNRNVAAAAVGLSITGCADPCFDDGLAQGGCPSVETETETQADTDETDSAAATESASASGTDSAGDTAGSGGGGEFECPDFDEVLLPQTPTFQLVIDRSGSMDEDFGGVSRWDATKQTLTDPQMGIVSALQSQIRFGVTLYSNPMGSRGCPTIDALAPQLDAADEISTLLDGHMPMGDTPTGESLELIAADLLADDWPGEKIIVLTTDGEPDTCEQPDPETDQEIAQARGAAVDAVTSAHANGIRTFVISVGSEVGEDHLQELANAGQGVGGGEPDAEFYVANDTEALVAAFESIIAGVRTCTFDLSEPLAPAQIPDCELLVNDAAVPFDDPDGWVQTGDTEIELQGGACGGIQEGVVIIELNCGCEA